MLLERRRRRKRRLVSDLNVVPYIDVMLVLLIIFMVTAPILTQGIKVDLPQAESKAISQVNQRPFIVSVNSRGEVFINQEGSSLPINRVQLRQMASAWQAKYPDKPAYIRADRNLAYGKVVQVMAWLQSAGIAKIGLITQDEDSAPKT